MEEARSETLEIVKLYYQDYEYRHRNFWKLIFSSIFVIVGLMAIPYFIARDDVNTNLPLVFFPIVSALVSVASMSILWSEAVRMQVIHQKLRDLRKDLSSAYDEIALKTYLDDINNRRKVILRKVFKPINKIICVSITVQLLLFYIALVLLAVAEIILLYKGYIIFQ